MRILVAPDKFKGTLSATEVAAAISLGLRDALPTAEVICCPMADGGEGTVATLHANLGGELVSRRVTGPLPEMKVEATYLLIKEPRTAVVELATASGLHLLGPADRDPLATTTFGSGQLIADAVAAGATRIILALGGSATVDAGLGMLHALHFTLLTIDGEPTPMSEPICGRDIGRILAVKHGRGEATNGIEIIAAADVTAPLPGAAQLFGPQKGATPATVKKLEADMATLVARTATHAEAALPGAGAAGGVGYAVAAFMRGRIVPGFDTIADLIGFDDRLRNIDLCVTGEGRLDPSTALGKTVAGVAGRCEKFGVPCTAVVGSVDNPPAIDGLLNWITLGDDRTESGIRAAAAACGFAFGREP